MMDATKLYALVEELKRRSAKANTQSEYEKDTDLTHYCLGMSVGYGMSALMLEDVIKCVEKG
jgi:hypothetical protein